MATKIESITKSSARQIAQAAELALNEALRDLGVRAKVGRGTINLGDSLTYKIEFTLEGGKTREEAAYDGYRANLNLPPLGTEFQSGGKVYKVTGFRPAATKRPVVCRRADGKVFVYPVAAIRALTAGCR